MDIQEQFILYHNATEKDDAESQLKLGMHYLTSDRVTDGINMIIKAYKQDYTPAIYTLARLNEIGEHVPFNQELAFELFKLGLSLNHLPSIYKIGEYLFYGEVGDEDQDEGFKYIESAAIKGYSIAEYEMYNFYAYGDYLSEDTSKAFFWLNRSAEHDYFKAQFTLGKLYLIQKNNYDKAFDLFYRAINNALENINTPLENDEKDILDELSEYVIDSEYETRENVKFFKMYVREKCKNDANAAEFLNFFNIYKSNA